MVSTFSVDHTENSWHLHTFSLCMQKIIKHQVFESSIGAEKNIEFLQQMNCSMQGTTLELRYDCASKKIWFKTESKKWSLKLTCMFWLQPVRSHYPWFGPRISQMQGDRVNFLQMIPPYSLAYPGHQFGTSTHPLAVVSNNSVPVTGQHATPVVKHKENVSILWVSKLI